MDEPTPRTEKVKHPHYYNQHPAGIECYRIVQEFSYNCGTAMAYIWRAEYKHETPIEDLMKAREHLTFEIERLTAIKNKLQNQDRDSA